MNTWILHFIHISATILIGGINMNKKIELELKGRRGGKVFITLNVPDDEKLIESLKDPNNEEDWVKEYKKSILDEYYNDLKNTRRHTSMTELSYESSKYFDSKVDVENEFIEKENLKEVLAILTETERKRLTKNIIQQMSLVDIATEEGVTEAAVRKSVKKALNKIKKFYY